MDLNQGHFHSLRDVWEVCEQVLVVAMMEVLSSIKSVALWKSKRGIARYLLQKRSTGSDRVANLCSKGWLMETPAAALLCYVVGVGCFDLGESRKLG